jgi:ATP-dependent helicase/nuclease subunit B
MEAFAETGATARALDRGARYLDFAHTLDRPETVAPAARPAPKPPVALRPDRLSVTRIETLRRDPYAIHAERILELQPLEPIGAIRGAREIGEEWHEILSSFSEAFPGDRLPEDARDRLIAMARDRFATSLADPAFRALAWPRIAQGLDYFLAFDRDQRGIVARVVVETDGRLDIPLPGGGSFRLTARADRIDLLRGGGAVLVDYKTGTPPGLGEVEVGFAPQLTLEAAMLARGAFPDAPGVKAVAALYLKLGGAKGGETRELVFKDTSFSDVVEAHYAQLLILLAQFAQAETPYLSRPYPKFAGRFGAYDHLARVKEWSATGGKTEGAAG